MGIETVAVWGEAVVVVEVVLVLVFVGLSLTSRLFLYLLLESEGPSYLSIPFSKPNPRL